MAASQSRAGELDAAFENLRHAVAEGQVRDAEHIAGVIGEMLIAEHGAGSPVPGAHEEAMGWLLSGISAVLEGEHWTAIQTLEKITSRNTDSKTLCWAAALWICWAALDLADVDRAQAAGESIIALSSEMDGRSRSVSLCTKAEVDAGCGAEELAMQNLGAACALFEGLGDSRGHAAACLSKARVLAGMGQDLDSVFAARNAQSLAPDWDEPIIFLATMSLRDGNLSLTQRHLDDLDRLGPRPYEGRRLAGLTQLVERGQVPLWVVAEYLRLREALPSEAIVDEIQALTLYSPKLYPLREELAWKLIRMGHYADARTILDRLTAEEAELDPDTLESVKLAVSSLAGLEEPDRPPEARVHAMVSSTAAPETETETETGAKQPPAPPAAPGSPRRSEQWVQRAVDAIAGKRSVFSGDLRTLGTPDLLEFLRNGRRTGTLILTGKAGTGAIFVRSGMIITGSSPQATNIGQLLRERGAIDDGQLAEVASCQDNGGHSTLMGAMFVDKDMVDAETVKKALSDQVFAVVRELFQWQEGHFAFLPESPSKASSPELEIELDPQFVLLEVARGIDEDNK